MSERERKAKPITAAGRRRVARAFDRHGLLLVQGQAELPSLADLLEGQPVTTRGYSWDYVPAWNLRWELEQQQDVANLKLFRGRSTLVARRLWPAVDALARASRAGVLAGYGADDRRTMLELIEENGRIRGEAIKHATGWTSKAFQRVKNDLAQWLCVACEEYEEQEDEGHTHDMDWVPWDAGKVARALRRRKTRPSVSQATAQLLEAVYPDGDGAGARPTTLFPLLKPAQEVTS